MGALLAPGGAVVLEDIDFTGAFCHPDHRGYRRYVELYRETVRRRGGDADLGPRLPALLHRAGLHAVEVRVAQPVALTGPGKQVTLLTLERIAPAVVAERVASEAEVAAALDELRAFTADETSLIAFPRIVQAWGRRPPTVGWAPASGTTSEDGRGDDAPAPFPAPLPWPARPAGPPGRRSPPRCGRPGSSRRSCPRPPCSWRWCSPCTSRGGAIPWDRRHDDL